MRRWALCLLLTDVALAAEPVRTLAVLGDSLSTGAASHPALAFDGEALWGVFTAGIGVEPALADLPAGIIDQTELVPPQRLWPSAREFFGGPDWVYRHTLQILSRTYLDTEEYSWGYLMGLKLGVPPANILIAGEDGSRAQNIPRHLDRVLDATGGTWPDRILMLYTGNDLCGLTLAQMTSVEEFEAALNDGFDYVLANGSAAAGGTTIDLLSFLGILQLLHDESILSKSIVAFGTKTTCRELKANGYRAAVASSPTSTPPTTSPAYPWYFGLFMPPNPAAFCPTLFGDAGASPEEALSQLANRVRNFREAEARAVARADGQAKELGLNVRFRHVKETADVQFNGDDIAADCFHLSAKGQAKVAAAALNSAVGR